jgi:hypothetical protein
MINYALFVLAILACICIAWRLKFDPAEWFATLIIGAVTAFLFVIVMNGLAVTMEF